MNENALTKPEVEKLFNEKTAIETWLNPKPDPNVWPPKGWQQRLGEPGQYYRIATEEELRKELFNQKSPEDLLWEKQARGRLAEIDSALVSYFFPKLKEEGIQRKTKSGFAAMVETGLKRKIDEPVLDAVLESCEIYASENDLDLNVEDKVVEYKPTLKLGTFRELPDGLRKVFENALVITPDKIKFEIVRVAD